MNDIRIKGTLIVWAALAAIAIGIAGISIPLDEFTIWQMVIILTALGIGVPTTGFIWGWGEPKYASQFNHSADIAEESSKAKGGDRLQAILERLSDEELLDLRERMKDAQFTLDERGNLIRK